MAFALTFAGYAMGIYGFYLIIHGAAETISRLTLVG